MLEIFMLFRLCGWLGDKGAEKGHGAVPYQLLLVFLWVGGEVSGVVLGVVVTYVWTPMRTGRTPAVYSRLRSLRYWNRRADDVPYRQCLADQRDSLALEGDRVWNDPDRRYDRDHDDYNRDKDDHVRDGGRTDANKAPRSNDDRYTTEVGRGSLSPPSEQIPKKTACPNNPPA